VSVCQYRLSLGVSSVERCLLYQNKLGFGVSGLGRGKYAPYAFLSARSKNREKALLGAGCLFVPARLARSYGHRLRWQPMRDDLQCNQRVFDWGLFSRQEGTLRRLPATIGLGHCLGAKLVDTLRQIARRGWHPD